MSALGQKHILQRKRSMSALPPIATAKAKPPQTVMSALPPKADMCSASRDVRFVPIADISSPFNYLGGAGIADEWWSMILQSLPSFTNVKL